MATSDAETVEQYLDQLQADRREQITTVRLVVLDNLPPGYEESMRWGMITYEVPLETFPDTYNGQPLMYAAIASQKRHMSLYLTNVYADADLATWFEERYRASGKRLDMGRSCVRFRTIDDLPLDLVAETIAATSVDDMIALHGSGRGA